MPCYSSFFVLAFKGRRAWYHHYHLLARAHITLRPVKRMSCAFRPNYLSSFDSLVASLLAVRLLYLSSLRGKHYVFQKRWKLLLRQHPNSAEDRSVLKVSQIFQVPQCKLGQAQIHWACSHLNCWITSQVHHQTDHCVNSKERASLVKCMCVMYILIHSFRQFL